MITALMLGLAFLPGAGAQDLVTLITQEATRSGVDVDLALAVAWHESRLRPNQELREPKLKTSSIGIFQVLLPTARSMGFRGTKAELFDPKTNIHFGVRYLSQCLRRFGSNLDGVLCCYNAGLRVSEPFCKTPRIRHYVSQVRPWYESLKSRPALKTRMARIARGEHIRLYE
jgi:soluble lytic murein transglycosylase-like protein